MSPLIRKGMDVTVEDEAFENNRHKGRNATVVSVDGAFAVIEIEDVGIRGCLVDDLQPRLTAKTLGLRP